MGGSVTVTWSPAPSKKKKKNPFLFHFCRPLYVYSMALSAQISGKFLVLQEIDISFENVMPYRRRKLFCLIRDRSLIMTWGRSANTFEDFSTTFHFVCWTTLRGVFFFYDITFLAERSNEIKTVLAYSILILKFS